MARTWLQIRIELIGGGGIELPATPGRVLLVGPRHTFAQLAEAIDIAFARWDRSHLHLFELPDGRQIGLPDLDPDPDEPADAVLDGTALTVAAEAPPGTAFRYLFDLGEDWDHHCRVLAEKVDPLEEYGARPATPVPIMGWGWIPDQYGRDTDDDAE